MSLFLHPHAQLHTWDTLLVSCTCLSGVCGYLLNFHGWEAPPVMVTPIYRISCMPFSIHEKQHPKFSSNSHIIQYLVLPRSSSPEHTVLRYYNVKDEVILSLVLLDLQFWLLVLVLILGSICRNIELDCASMFINIVLYNRESKITKLNICNCFNVLLSIILVRFLLTMVV